MNSIVDVLNLGLTAAADAVFWVLAGLPSVWSLIIVSLLSGVALLIVYGKVSSQRRIREVKRKISASMLEAVLFRHDLRACLGAQCRMFVYGAAYLAWAVPPLLILTLPCVLILAQLNLRYNTAGLPVGRPAVLRVTLENENYLDSISIIDVHGAEVTPRLRVAGEKSVLWRVTPRDESSVELAVRVDTSGETHRQRVGLAAARPQVLPAEHVKQWWWALLYPGVRMLPSDSPISEISFSYPEARYSFLGLHWHWILLFFVVSLLGGLAAAKLLGIAV